MSKKNVDVLFVYIVYIKTEMCMNQEKEMNKSKALVAMVCKMKQKTLFHYKSTLF